MSELPPGVTRYPRRTGWQLRRFRPIVDIPFGVICVLLSVVVPLNNGADPGTVAVFAVVGLLFPPLLVIVPWRTARIVLYVVAMVATAAWAGDRHTAGPGGAISAWFVCFLTGGGALLFLAAEQKFRRRMASAEGAPPSGKDPAQGKDVGLLARWEDAEHEYEAVDPDPEIVVAAVRRLDGDWMDTVSVWRGHGRLDVGGDASGAMIVQQSDTRTSWHQVEDPNEAPLSDAKAARAAPHETIRFGSMDLSYPRRRLTRLPAAEIAVRSWILRGERDASLTWWSDTRLVGVLRPASLKASD